MSLSSSQTFDYDRKVRELLDSSLGYTAYQLSKCIASVISPISGKTGSNVLNSKHFAETMRDITIEEDELLVSFDVFSLFTNVPLVKQCRSSKPSLGRTIVWPRESHSRQIG